MNPQKSSILKGDRVTLMVMGVGRRERQALRLDTPGLLVTLEASVARVSHRGLDLTLDRSGCLVVPRKTEVTLRTPSPTTRVVLLRFHEPLLSRVVKTYAKHDVHRARLEGFLARLELLPRTVWIHELVHRYVFERLTFDQHDNEATRFLETEILKEVYFLFRDRDAGADRATAVRQLGPLAKRAVAYIEAHLFERCDVREVARHAGASESTLLRSFRREVGCTPAVYWRSRKLDESLVLVRAGSQSVAEIATRIGYDNPTAFGFAFRRRFGAPPTGFRPSRPVRPAP
jgi:AraC-like DNA-binding protein